MLSMVHVLLAAALVVGTAGPTTQGEVSVRTLFEAGRYDDAIARVDASEAPDPEALYLKAQCYVRLKAADAAKSTLGRLAQRGKDDAWALVAEAESARIDKDLVTALTAAKQAVATDPNSAYAHYQLGLVYSQRQDMALAADAFETATSVDPTLAYAHYYAGLVYSNVKRIDRMASHFETFLKLAPEAPERGAVESIMRTLRGR